VNADPEDDAAVRLHAGVTLDHGVLNFDCAAHGVDDAAEFDKRAIASALDDSAIVHGDGRVDEVAAKRPQPRQCPVLVRACKPTEAYDIGGQYSGKFAGLIPTAMRIDRYGPIGAFRLM
jgi:hypothetical protein